MKQFNSAHLLRTGVSTSIKDYAQSILLFSRGDFLDFKGAVIIPL